MEKFTTEQLKSALICLRNRTDKDGISAYEMTFDEVWRRMGDFEFDKFCTANGW